jgi:hypothetical protein
MLVHEADKSSGERVQKVEIIFNFIGRFVAPSEPPAPPTEEELAAEEKRRARLAGQREANCRWYTKKKAEQTAGKLSKRRGISDTDSPSFLFFLAPVLAASATQQTAKRA